MSTTMRGMLYVYAQRGMPVSPHVFPGVPGPQRCNFNRIYLTAVEAADNSENRGGKLYE